MTGENVIINPIRRSIINWIIFKRLLVAPKRSKTCSRPTEKYFEFQNKNIRIERFLLREIFYENHHRQFLNWSTRRYSRSWKVRPNHSGKISCLAYYQHSNEQLWRISPRSLILIRRSSLQSNLPWQIFKSDWRYLNYTTAQL